MNYGDFARECMAEGELSARVQTAVRTRLFALAFWQEASRATAALAARGVALRFEPLLIDGFSLGFGARDVWVTREQDHVAVVPHNSPLFSTLQPARHEPPSTPADMQHAAEATMGQVLAHLLARTAV